jgi:hypothetical protein
MTWNKRLRRAKYDTTIACRQGKVKQEYILKARVDTVICLTK